MLNNEILVSLSEKWYKHGAKVQFVQESESYVYKLVSGSAESYLRITSDVHRPEDQIIAELDFVLYLYENGLLVSIPVKNVYGKYIEIVKVSGKTFYAVMFVPAPGEQVIYRSDQWIEPTFNKWGAYLGNLHSLCENYTVPSIYKRIDWKDDLIISQAKEILAQNNETDALNEFTYLMDEIVKYEKSKEVYGLIHGDLGLANFRLFNGNITSFDFDDSIYHWFMYDIAVALWPTRFLPDEERNNYLKWFITGYVKHRNVDSLWLDRIPFFIRLRNIYMFIYRLKNINKFNINDKESWFRNMRKSFVKPVKWDLNRFV
ncbi:MAG TPA: phosphotransferase [Ignavibacteria bacterium]|nr:hypothetical protein [Bacteroidota bacterium]HRE12551.1 phosphotransferase [Ignavibacteria bacterium]HRF65736.1 phosphotransferase [Ignavibacteria bacterium]HRJ05263.1 phosphotransferase [Ignavibacteria bacterium]